MAREHTRQYRASRISLSVSRRPDRSRTDTLFPYTTLFRSRYTPISPYHIQYEATIEDPKVFTRPWKVSFPLYRRVEPNVQLVEFNCVPFVEELMYGPLGLFKRQSQ